MKYLVVQAETHHDDYYGDYYVSTRILDALELTELTAQEKKALERAGFLCLVIKSTEEVKTIIQDLRDKEAQKKKKAEEQKKKKEEAKKLKQAQAKKLKEEEELKLLEQLKEKYE